MKNQVSRKSILLFFVFLNFIFVSSQKKYKIVSLAPSLTKNIYFLNVQDKLIGCTSYCKEAINDNKEIIASAIKVNLEKVISLEPDLVIATSITNPETIQSLKKFGIRVEIFTTPKSFAEICDQFLRLGKLVFKEDLALKIINESKTKVDDLIKKTVHSIQPKIFFQIGEKPMYTVIPNTFMDDYIQFSGGINIASDLNNGSISRESVLARNPDVILIVTMGVVGEEEKKIWKSYQSINAVKNNKIYIIDADLSCSPTPVTFVETLEIIVELITD